MSPTFVILTGGKSTRFGSDKSTIDFAGESLVNRILKNLPQGQVIIVGPEFVQEIRKVTFIQENPLGGGPVAAIATALPLVTSDELCAVATDMPFAGDVIGILLQQPLVADVLIPIDKSGIRQSLCARYRRQSLADAIALLGDPTGKSMRAVLEKLNVAELAVETSRTSKLIDIDTPADLEKVLLDYREELDRK